MSTRKSSINNDSPVTEQEVRAAREEYGSLYLRELLARQLSTRFGIVSFCKDPRHPLMWSHYTTDGSGFVIAYDAQQLRKLSSRTECLRPVQYFEKVPPIVGYVVLASPESNMDVILSMKGSHWKHEEEWRLIVELKETIGTGHQDRHGQPVNLIRVPNHAVVGVYHTERTPAKAVDSVTRRLANANNRYRVTQPIKLVLSPKDYGYEDAPDGV